MIGITIGTGLSDELLAGLTPSSVTTDLGTVDFYSGTIADVEVAMVPRHGIRHDVPPHLIDHGCNMASFPALGATRVIGLSSTGSLKRMIRVPSILIPEDYIELSPASIQTRPVSIVPGLSVMVRKALLDSAKKTGIKPYYDRGVYYQSTGPRLETVSEVKFLSTMADVVGMTMGSEATVARELGIEYASLCTVDNYANGIAEDLTQGAIKRSAVKNTLNAWTVVERAIGYLNV